MTARDEFCEAIINRNRIERQNDCTGREGNGACEACSQYTNCQGRVERAREAVRKEYASNTI